MDTPPGHISRRIPVPPAFEEVFTHFYFAANKSPHGISQTLLPSYQMIMVFNFGTPVSLITQQKEEVSIDTCLVVGPIRKAFDYTLPPGAEMLVANFKGDAFYRCFGVACMEQAFSGHPDALLHDNCFIELWTRLSGLGNEERVGHILDFCKPYIRERTVGRYGLSERALQMNHKKQFGFSAKEIARYHRFLKAIGMIERFSSGASRVDWFEIIHECGYYDQSQLIHDFKHYLHLSPTKYLQFQQGICNPMP